VPSGTSLQIPNGVVSRCPIKSIGRFTDSSVANRGFAWAQIDIPGPKDLWVVSVHLLANTAAHEVEGTEIINDLKSFAHTAGRLPRAGRRLQQRRAARR
jgi:endonuclease/exonuclease/phosphatase family metal-dependent hydrolase